MQNEAGDIVQELTEDTYEWKAKARVARDAAVDATKAAYHTLQDKTAVCTRAADETIREKPYMAIGVAFGVGALLGLLLTGGKKHEERQEC